MQKKLRLKTQSEEIKSQIISLQLALDDLCREWQRPEIKYLDDTAFDAEIHNLFYQKRWLTRYVERSVAELGNYTGFNEDTHLRDLPPEFFHEAIRRVRQRDPVLRNAIIAMAQRYDRMRDETVACLRDITALLNEADDRDSELWEANLFEKRAHQLLETYDRDVISAYIQAREKSGRCPGQRARLGYLYHEICKRRRFAEERKARDAAETQRQKALREINIAEIKSTGQLDFFTD